jgi:hypothetical protein
MLPKQGLVNYILGASEDCFCIPCKLRMVLMCSKVGAGRRCKRGGKKGNRE